MMKMDMARGTVFCFVVFTVLFFALAAGTADAAEKFKAEVMTVEGTVTVFGGEGKLKRLEEGALIGEGDLIATGEDAKAELAFDGNRKNVVQIGENSQVRLDSVHPTVLNVEGGDIFAMLDSLPKEVEFKVKSPHAVASICGTIFLFRYRDGVTDIYSYQGALQIEHQGRRWDPDEREDELTEYEMIRVDEDGNAGYTEAFTASMLRDMEELAEVLDERRALLARIGEQSALLPVDEIEKKSSHKAKTQSKAARVAAIEAAASAPDEPWIRRSRRDEKVDVGRFKGKQVEVVGVSESRNAWATIFYWDENAGEYRIQEIKRVEVGDVVPYPCRICTAEDTSLQLVHDMESDPRKVGEELVHMRPSSVKDFPGAKTMAYGQEAVHVYEGKVEVRGIFDGKPVALPIPEVPLVFNGIEIFMVTYDPCFVPTGPWRKKVEKMGLSLDASLSTETGAVTTTEDGVTQIDFPGGNLIL